MFGNQKAALMIEGATSDIDQSDLVMSWRKQQPPDTAPFAADEIVDQNDNVIDECRRLVTQMKTAVDALDVIDKKSEKVIENIVKLDDMFATTP